MSRMAVTAICLDPGLSGCNLFNPYVSPDSHTIDEGRDANRTAMVRPCVHFPSGMQGAVHCASTLKAQYVLNMGDQAKLSPVSEVGLIALTAYTAGIATNSGHRTNVTDFALGTAALYGMSQWPSQPECTKIYGLGLKAAQCAVDVSVPLQINAANMVPFQAELTKLDKQIALTSDKLAMVQALLANDPGSTAAPTIQARARVAVEVSSVEQARTESASGSQIVAAHNRAPFELVSAVDGINASANEGLGWTEQSMSALPGALSGIMAMYSDLVSGFVSARHSPPASAETANQTRRLY
ncbi:MAG: hypothetical protein ACFHX7_22130 [Pseudomonadota bacterium]